MMNKAGGFITLHRQIMDWEWYKDINTAFLFIHLLLSANFTEAKFKGMTIRRGQLVTSFPSLATGTGLTIQQTRTALSHLISTGEVTDEVYHNYRIITVVKYDDYQSSTDKATDDQQTINRQTNRQSTDDLTGHQQQYNNNNKYNKETNKQGNNKEILLEGFAKFWSAYPRKDSKAGAKKAFDKLKPNEELLNTMLMAIEKQKASSQWQDSRYIPYASTWLNGRRWEDEVQSASSSSKPPVQSRRTVVAQDYEQRDYSEEHEQSPDEKMAWIKQMMLEEGV